MAKTTNHCDGTALGAPGPCGVPSFFLASLTWLHKPHSPTELMIAECDHTSRIDDAKTKTDFGPTLTAHAPSPCLTTQLKHRPARATACHLQLPAITIPHLPLPACQSIPCLSLALEIGIGIGKIAVRLMIGHPCHFGSVIGNRTPNSDFR